MLDKFGDEVENFYSTFRQTLKKLRKRDITIVMGEFNAKLCKKKLNENVGPCGLGERNRRGDRLNIFATEEELGVLNTF